MTPELVQVMLWDVPAFQFSPPFGEVTVIIGWIIVNVPSLWSVTLELLVSVTITRQFEEDTMLGTVQEYEPLDALVLATICVQLEPPFVEYSILTLVTSLLVQVML